MFQFTTTNVINSNLDSSGKKKWYADTESNSFRVLRVNDFKADSIQAVYKAAATDAQLAKVCIDLSQITATAGDMLRLDIYLGLTPASQDSRYANDLIYKGKPLSVDFVWKDTAANTVAELEKILKKYAVLVYGDKLLNVKSNDTKLIIEATTEYQRFKKINIDKFDSEARFYMGEYVPVLTIADLTEVNTNAEADTTSGKGNIFVGKEGFGTYSWILHNLRLPTYARTRAFATNSDETPVVGGKYDQYTIHYCVDRGVLGTNAVGHAVKSVTTHVFYVKSDLSSQFASDLTNVLTESGSGITITNVPA